MTHVRSNATQLVVLERYFDLLECTLNDNNLFHQSAQIFNLDKTGIPLDPKVPYIVCSRGQRHPSYINGGSKTQR